MADLKYTLQHGVYRFSTDFGIELHLRNIRRDRFGSVYADSRFLTPEGAILALSSGNLSTAAGRRDLVSQAAARNSGDLTRMENVVIEALVALMDDPRIVPQDRAALKPQLISAKEFVSMAGVEGEYLVENLYEMGTLQAVVAKPKTAKSLLTLDLAVKVAQGGGLWLGRNVKGGRVALFQLEDSPRTISRRLQMLASRSIPENLWVHRADTPFAISEESYSLVLDDCQGCSLIVVDPIIQASHVGDWNAASEVRAAYELWRRLARELNAVVVVVAHHRKLVGDFGDQIAGSVQGLATPDGIVELRRDTSLTKTQRKVSYVGRDWPDLEEEVIELDPETLRFTVVGTASCLAEDRRKQANEGRAEELLASLPADSPGVTLNDLQAVTGWKDKMIRDAMKVLSGDNRVGSTGKPRSRTDPQRFYRKDKRSE